MRVKLRGWLVPLLLGTVLSPAVAGPGGEDAPQTPAPRAVAVTFDDLPGPSPGLTANDLPTLRRMTDRLLAALAEHRVPAVGFVTTGLLRVRDETDADLQARRDVVRRWLRAGHELGNHSHSHRSLNRTPLAEFQEDVLLAEREIEAILGGGKKTRFFRHPMLHVGADLDRRSGFESWLRERGYRIGVVTMDNDDYVYAAAYAAALRRGDEELARRLGEDYARYMEEIVGYWEEVAQEVVGGPIPHVLLLHANRLNADHFGRLAGMLKGRGYRFVSLEEALSHEAYELPDTWVGEWGLSWLHHWALTAGKERAPDPDPPGWVMEAFENRRR